jgi:hypothetical protein
VTRRSAAYLYVFAGWTVFVWVVFIKNITKAHQFSSGFKAIHITLAIISIVFAAGCFYVVGRTRRSGRVGDGAEREPAER